jgi:predicted RNase H-like nuclease
MRTVLGIDRAWTRVNPSGVALLLENGDRWNCEFLAFDYADCPKGPANESELVAAIAACGYQRPCVVAVDMPLAKKPISGRRVSDNKVSEAFGKYKCGTHSPSVDRPGLIAEEVRTAFEGHGFSLQTFEASYCEGNCHLVEVYPHPAIVRLANASERLCYKVSKTNSYWKGQSRQTRLQLVIEVLEQIVRLLRSTGIVVDLEIPRATRFSDLKAYEDKVDALVCAWVGVEYLRHQAEPYGDEDSAIWIPKVRASRAATT